MDSGTAEWIRELPEEELKRRFGAPTFFRAKNYHDAGHVSALAEEDGGFRSLVAGSGHRVYSVEVRMERDGSLQSWCSCPVGWACKHVVATLLAARQENIGAGEPAGWEQELSRLVATSSQPDEGKALALEFSVAMSGGRPSAVHVRPLREGSRTPWVRQDASWMDLLQSWRSTELNPVHRSLLTQLYRLGSGPQYTYGNSSTVDLADLGALAWPLLRRVADGGVEFLPGEGLRSVALADRTASVGLDVTRTDDGGLRACARADVVDTGPGATTFLVGTPAHGLAHLRAGELTLWGLVIPPADGLDRLMAEQRTIDIPPEDVNRFLTLYHPALVRAGGVTSSDGSVTPPDLSPPRLHLRLTHLPEHITRVEWGFAYPSPVAGSEPSILPLRPEPGGPPREARVESRLLASALPAVARHRELTRPGRIPMASPAELRGMAIADFMTETLPALRRIGVIVEEDGSPADYAEADEAPVIHVASEDGDDHDWFNLHVTVTVDGQDVPFDQLFSALAAGDDALLLDSGTWFSLDLPELHALRRLIEEARELTEDSAPGELRISPFQAALWEDLVELGVVARQSQRWRESVTGLLPSSDRLEVQPPSGLRASLRHYQLEGYRWLASLWDAGLGGVLADDMGLGKTLQTLALLERAREAGELDGRPVLVVAPASVVGTWIDEAARFAPGLEVVAITSTSRKQGEELAARIEGAHVVITSYTLLRLEDAAYRDVPWSALVLDEAQFVKNHRSRTYQAARRLGAPFTLAITGTPLENSLMDLWAMLSLAAPGLFPRPDHFIERYRKPIEMERDREALERLRRRIRPFVLRRTKREVVRELPEKIEQVQRVDLTPAHRKVYDKQLQRERQRVLGMLDDLDSNRIAIFRALTMLRQLALDPALVDEKHATSTPSAKVAALVEQVGELAAEGHRALVFSSFTGYLKLVRDALTAEGIGHVYLDGRTRDRPARVRQFREGEDPVFLISLKAGGFGLTLTEADYVFVLDPWWNPAAENQAIDRTHRIGQTRSVNVYKMVSVDTIEEKVVALQERKRDLFTSVVDSGTFSSGAISADDIRGLFED